MKTPLLSHARPTKAHKISGGVSYIVLIIFLGHYRISYYVTKVAILADTLAQFNKKYMKTLPIAISKQLDMAHLYHRDGINTILLKSFVWISFPVLILKFSS